MLWAAYLELSVAATDLSKTKSRLLKATVERAASELQAELFGILGIRDFQSVFAEIGEIKEQLESFCRRCLQMDYDYLQECLSDAGLSGLFEEHRERLVRFTKGLGSQRPLYEGIFGELEDVSEAEIRLDRAEYAGIIKRKLEQIHRICEETGVTLGRKLGKLSGNG